MMAIISFMNVNIVSTFFYLFFGKYIDLLLDVNTTHKGGKLNAFIWKEGSNFKNVKTFLF